MKQSSIKKYCSLDIETTGFDPLNEEVLEVGFAFFEVSDKGIKITEEWTQVFKPNKEVSPQIFGLTGISKAELETAPAFSEHRDFIQQKLGDAVIVGHNISFDTKFLEAFGIKFSGETIDTLDLVQWLLPTHHSYNLENLMHTFGISHKEAHRALADSKATLRVLEKLLQIFAALPSPLKDKIKKLIAPQNFLWSSFLDAKIKPEKLDNSFNKIEQIKRGKLRFSFENKAFYNFPLEENLVDQVASIIKQKKALIVVPGSHQVLELYKKGMVEAAVFLPEQQFSEKKFNALQKTKSLSPEQVKFVLKILVWQETNWQTDTILDLNLSFFGGQFKTLISGGKIKKTAQNLSVVCDISTFLEIAQQNLFEDYEVVICGLSEFETAITSGISTKVSWGYFNYLIKSYYNPELNTGNKKLRSAAENSLTASDLFFGLTSALLKNEGQTFEYYKLNATTQNDEKWNKVLAAAESFIEKIRTENQILKSEEVEKFLNHLSSFISNESNRVKWIELAENRCVFFSMPLDISSLVSDALKKFAKVSFADSLDEEILPAFYLRRLGLKDFKAQKFVKNPNKNIMQGDLFGNVKKIFAKKQEVKVHYVESAATEKDILKILNSKNPWPASVLFASPVMVKEFYEKNYEDLKQKVSLLAQTSYGGSNKLLRNFGINKNSLMLVTDKFILKSMVSGQAAQVVNKVPVKTLVICRLPFDQFTHPYQEAVSAAMSNAFEDYALPKAFNNFHTLIKLFYTPSLQDIYVIDAKLSKPYAKIFKDYWKLMEQSKIIS